MDNRLPTDTSPRATSLTARPQSFLANLVNTSCNCNARASGQSLTGHDTAHRTSSQTIPDPTSRTRTRHVTEALHIDPINSPSNIIRMEQRQAFPVADPAPCTLQASKRLACPVSVRPSQQCPCKNPLKRLNPHDPHALYNSIVWRDCVIVERAPRLSMGVGRGGQTTILVISSGWGVFECTVRCITCSACIVCIVKCRV